MDWLIDKLVNILRGARVEETPMLSKNRKWHIQKVDEDWLVTAPVDWPTIVDTRTFDTFHGAVHFVIDELRAGRYDDWSQPFD